MYPEKETPYKSAQAALDRLRQTFLSTVNHEMRTPLALIFQTITMFEDGYLGELTEEQLDAFMALRRQVETLSNMVDSLTRIAAFLSKQERVRLVMASLKPVFKNVLSLAEFKAQAKELTIEVDIAPHLPIIPLDVKQLDEALTHLLDNAIKFNHPGGKIEVKAWSNEAWVIITVADNGIGIDPEHIEVIWEIFEQGGDPLRRAQEGLGLGLTLVHYIIAAHQGTISVKTVSGQGSVFTLKLPKSRNPT